MGPDFNLSSPQRVDLFVVESRLGVSRQLSPVLFRSHIAAVINIPAVFPKLKKRLETYIKHFRHAPKFFLRRRPGDHFSVV